MRKLFETIYEEIYDGIMTAKIKIMKPKLNPSLHNHKTREQIDQELMKLMQPKLLRKVHQKKDERADVLFFKMLDARNLSLIGYVLNWCHGRIDSSPVEFYEQMMMDRKAKTPKGTNALFDQWLNIHKIDTRFLEAILHKVVVQDKKINNIPNTIMTDEQKVEGQVETPTPAEQPAPEAPVDAPAEAPAENAEATPAQ